MTFNPSQYRVPAGSAGGGQFGVARDAQAAKAQQDKQAQAAYTQLMKLPPDKRAAFVKGLTTAQLQKLTAIVYSSRTSDKNVVAAREVVAAEMGKRGQDIKKFGALGGGSPAKKAAAVKRAMPGKPPAKARATAKQPAKPAAKSAQTAAPSSQGRGTFSARAQ